MAVIAKVNNTGTVGRVEIKTSARTSIASQNFAPKPNVALSELTDISTQGVQDGFTLVFNSDTGKYEAAPLANVAIDITNITGGFF